MSDVALYLAAATLGLTTFSAADPDPNTFNLTTLLAILAILGAGGGIVVTLIQTAGKRVKTPADRQAEVALGVAILEKQIERNAVAEARWLEVEKFLREQVRLADGVNEKLRSALTAAQEEIAQLLDERDDLRGRQARLAAKVARGEPVVLSDITGEDPDNSGPIGLIVAPPLPDELEDTGSPVNRRAKRA